MRRWSGPSRPRSAILEGGKDSDGDDEEDDNDEGTCRRRHERCLLSKEERIILRSSRIQVVRQKGQVLPVQAYRILLADVGTVGTRYLR